MEKKIEIERRYKFLTDDEIKIGEYVKKLESDLGLLDANYWEITNDDVYYDNDDILEAYKIIVRKRVENNRESYILKNTLTSDQEFTKRAKYEFDTLEELLDFLKSKFNLVIDSLNEKMSLRVKRRKYIRYYKSALVEICFDEVSDGKGRNFMIECKYVTGNIEDFAKVSKRFKEYKFLEEIQMDKKTLAQEGRPVVVDNPFNRVINRKEYEQSLRRYFGDASSLLEKLKALNEKKQYIHSLHDKYGPLEKPIVVTISGTPRSGKTTCIDNLFEFFKKADFKTKCLEEPAGLVYATLKSREEKEKLLRDRVGFVERQLDIGQNSIMSNLTDNEILLCDRGVLDTYVWYDMYYKLGMIDKEKYRKFLESLKDSLPYYNQFYILYANVANAMYRDYQNSLSIEPRSTMNEENVRRYNSSLIRMIPSFEEAIDAVKFINTSDYEKMDASIMVANDLVDKIMTLYRKRVR